MTNSRKSILEFLSRKYGFQPNLPERHPSLGYLNLLINNSPQIVDSISTPCDFKTLEYVIAECFCSWDNCHETLFPEDIAKVYLALAKVYASAVNYNLHRINTESLPLWTKDKEGNFTKATKSNSNYQFILKLNSNETRREFNSPPDWIMTFYINQQELDLHKLVFTEYVCEHQQKRLNFLVEAYNFYIKNGFSFALDQQKSNGKHKGPYPLLDMSSCAQQNKSPPPSNALREIGIHGAKARWGKQQKLVSEAVEIAKGLWLDGNKSHHSQMANYLLEEYTPDGKKVPFSELSKASLLKALRSLAKEKFPNRVHGIKKTSPPT